MDPTSQVIYADFNWSPAQSLQVLNGLLASLAAQTLTGSTSGGIANAAGDVPWGILTLPSAGFTRLQAVLDVTAAASTGADTLDVYVDASLTPVGPTTPIWANVVHFTQVLGNGGAKHFIARTPSAAAGSVANVSTDLAAAAATVPFAATQVRVRTQRVDASASLSFTVGLTLLLLP